jgi:hypothetical protein
MSNTSAPNGFTYMRRLDGAEPNDASNKYPILYTQTDKMGYGDPVILVGGYLDIWASGLATGIFRGCEYVDSSIGFTWSKAWTTPSTAVSGTVYGYICDDPMAVFQVQVGGSTTTGVVFTQVGLNASPGGVGAPNTSGISVAYLDETTVSTTSTLPFRIVGLGTSVTNDALSAYDYVQVVLNNSSYKVGVVGA